MTNEIESMFITTDPKAGAKTCRRDGYPVNKSPINENVNDITQSKMFKDFFGDDVKQFQKIQQKENLQKAVVIDNGLNNRTKEAINESESISDSH